MSQMKETDADGTRAPERIAAELIGQVNSGALPVGEALPTERELCEMFGSSRPTVREALSVMQLRGFASLGGGKRPRAAKPSLDQVLQSAAQHIRYVLGDAESGAHLEQMRQFIEAGAARAAAENSSNIQLAQMQSALSENLRCIGTPEFPESDIAFHRAIVAVVGNPIILRLHDMFVSSLLATRPAVHDQRSNDEIVYEEHRRIYEAILNKNASSASELVEAHLARSYRSRLAAPTSLQSQSNTGTEEPKQNGP